MAVQLAQPGSEAVVEVGRRAIQDSSLYPLLVRPWSVNKVLSLPPAARHSAQCCRLPAAPSSHWWRTQTQRSGPAWFCILMLCRQVTVSLDACLVILLLINIAIFAPLLLGNVQLAEG